MAANIGKAIEAYLRKIEPGPSRFDAYAKALLSNDQEAANKILDARRGRPACVCSSAKLSASMPQRPAVHQSQLPQQRRPACRPEWRARPAGSRGSPKALEKPLQHLGQVQRRAAEPGGSTAFRRDGNDTRHNLTRQYKTPSLRNVAERPPYMDHGQFATLEQVIDHYNAAAWSLTAPPDLQGHNELNPLYLSAEEKQDLAAFLETLSGPLATDPKWLSPPG